MATGGSPGSSAPGRSPSWPTATTGKRLNSPNDLVYRSDGTLYFTDPPFGLPKAFDDPAKELPFSGVYLVKDGKVTLLTKELSGPNGIAFSPDEKYLYVDNWDLKRKVLMRYDGQRRRHPGAGQSLPRLHERARSRSRWTGSRWMWRVTCTCRLRGACGFCRRQARRWAASSLRSTTPTSPLATATAKSLYLTASTGLYRVRVGIPGVRPGAAVQAASR